MAATTREAVDYAAKIAQRRDRAAVRYAEDVASILGDKSSLKRLLAGSPKPAGRGQRGLGGIDLMGACGWPGGR